MSQSFWFCTRCYLLHPDGQACPKPGEESDAKALPPALLGRTKEGEIRPDENDFAKEMRISARVLAENGQLTPALEKHMREEIAKYKDLPGQKRWRDREIPFVIPAEFRRRKYF